VGRAVREDTEEIAEVGPRLDAVHATAREERVKIAFTSPPSSLPTKSQFFLLCGCPHNRNYAGLAIMPRTVVDPRESCIAALKNAA
jgi:hypothetical protein